MAWRVEVAARAARQIRKLSPDDARRIRDYLRTRLDGIEDARRLGKPLKGSALGDFWRYRVGDYRILAELHDDRLVILVIEAGHRREVYR